MSKLRMMMGCPGAGKSTYAKKMKSEYDVYVSRDEIRFSLVSEDEPYFSRENEVFAKFVEAIDEGLRANKTVWADATHLNKGSRMKLLNALKEKPDDIEIVYIKVPLERCLEQNAMRKGTRAYVPEDVLRDMHKHTSMPKYQEDKYIYTTIWVKEPEKIIFPTKKDNEE